MTIQGGLNKISENKPERIGVTDQPKLGRIEGFKLGKGISKENSDGSWTKEYVELQTKLPEGATDKDFVATFLACEYQIDQLLEQPKTAAATAKPTEQPTRIIMAPAEVDALPWTASQWIRKDDPDRKARPGEDAWAREDEVKDPRLLEMLKTGGGKFEMPGAYTFEHKVRPGYESGLIVRHAPKTERKTR